MRSSLTQVGRSLIIDLAASSGNAFTISPRKELRGSLLVNVVDSLGGGHPRRTNTLRSRKSRRASRANKRARGEDHLQRSRPPLIPSKAARKKGFASQSTIVDPN